MAFNKTKALEEAAKLVSQRKIPQAIKQYLVIAEQDSQDLPLLNTIGDLCVREGNIVEALRQFHRLADAYTREGFTLKAIAIYKKIAKLDSHSVDPILKLADLYAGQKLSHEANEQYKQALALCQRNSLHDKASQILKKLVAQDPANPAYRIRLAEYCQSAGQPEEALRGYLEATGIYFRQKNLAAANVSLKRAVEIGAQHVEVALWQARLAAEAGQFDEVSHIFQRAPELRSSLEGQTLLLGVYLGSGRLDDAATLVMDVYRSGPEGWELVSHFAAHCVETGNPDAALSVLGEVADLAVERGQSSEFTALLQKALEARPHHASSLDLISALCGRAGGEETPPAVLEALGRAFADAGQWARAETVFRSLAGRDEHNPAWQSLLKESRERQLTEQIVGPASAQPVVTEPASSLPQPAALELDFSREWESFAAAQPEPDIAHPTEPAPPPEPESRSEMGMVSPAPAPTYAETVEAPESAFPPSVPEPERPSSLADLGEERAEVEFYLNCGFLVEGGAALDKLAGKYPGRPQVVALRDRLAGQMAARKAEPKPPAPPPAESPEPPPSLHLAETASDFFKLETAKPPAEPVAEASEVAQAIVPQSEAESAEVPLLAEADRPDQAEEAADAADANAVSQPPQPGDTSVLGGLAEDLEKSWDDAEESAGAESPPQPARWTLENSALDDLARDLEMTLGESAGSAGPGAAGFPAGGEAGPSLFDSSLEELLSELSAGEESAPADDTPQTHYNLGVAFREMGLLDEAIGEFQKVVKGTAGMDSAPRMLEACSLLGICFMEKQMPEIAVRWLTRALRSPGLNEETTMALTYDLAAAYEQSGDGRTALEKFSEVYSLNIDYRDVAEKIQSLHSKRA
ncbi:MAG: hypothetical protein ACRD18_04390 [Terriglobia bacterium]